jgi:D-alanyl-D-alanine carboxypeptidase
VTTVQHGRGPSRAARRRRTVAAIVAVVAVAAATVIGVAWWSDARGDAPDAQPVASASPSTSPSASPSAPPAEPVDKTKSFFNRGLHSIDDANSIWVVGDKLRPLNPIDYVPQDLVTANVPYTANALLRAEAAAALEQMFAAALAEGAGQLAVQNAYRSYETQVSLHNRLVGQLGIERARAQSAVPGYSEHQTGLSADIISSPQVCSIEACFGGTPQGIWLAENAWRFGYHLRYPADKTPVTGYIYEPWHFRYVGLELAAELQVTATTTLEEFFELPAAPDYPPGV